MDVIILSAVARHESGMKPTACSFRVTAVGGSPLALTTNSSGAAVAELPSSPRPLRLKVEATPAATTYFDVSGHFEDRGGGELVFIDDPDTGEPTDRAEFVPVTVVDAVGAQVAIS